MPLSTGGGYLYFLMVILLWGWPVIGLVLWSAWRRGRLGTGVNGVVVFVPVAALVAQLIFWAGGAQQGFVYDRQKDEIASYLGDPERADVIRGGYVGTVTRGSLMYGRYQFPSLDGSIDHMLEIQLPPDDVTGVGAIDLVREIMPVQMPARLIIWPPKISLNPAMAPDDFFQRYFPAEQPDAFGTHTLIVALRPRQSIVVHPRQDGDASSWRWTDAVMDFDVH